MRVAERSGAVSYVGSHKGAATLSFLDIWALHKAANFGQIEIVQNLLELFPSNIDSFDQDGWAPLHLASFSGHVHVVELLIKMGANLNLGSLNEKGYMPIHAAAHGRNAAVVAVLVRNGAYADAQDSAGHTAMHIAAQNGDTRIIDILVRHGAAVDIRDKHGQTPLDVALGANRQAAADLLQMYLDVE